MRISVIIPNYNYAEFLPVVIDSLLHQTEPVDEIIVVDDGSTDNSREVIQSYGDKVTGLFQDNAGQGAAFSAGFAVATGDIICLLDSDDIFFPDKVKILKQSYKDNPQAKWIFHSLKHISFEEAKDVSRYPEFSAVTSKVIDEAQKMRRWGRLGYHAPATSGLTFRRDFIAGLFPLPAAKSIYISDHYIKFYAAAEGKGLHIDADLGGQIIHGNNLYTLGNAKAMATRARIFTNTAYYLYLKVPEIKRFCTNIMIEGLLAGKIAEISNQVEIVAGQYLKFLSPREFLFLKLKIAAKMILKNIH